MTSVMRAIVGLVVFASSSTLLAQSVVLPDLSAKPLVPNGRWAVVIGVAAYAREVGPLRYTAKEAREFSETLTGDLGFQPDKVRLLADKGQSPVAPTSANILAALDATLANPQLDKANLFVFYFSGHGVATPKGDFLLPSDATPGRFEEMGVSVHEVIGRIVKAGLKNVLFITDACRSGTANDFGAELTDLCHQANIAVILGCAPGKRSYEDETFEQGAFTHYLLEGIKDKTLRDESGALWASRLGADVQTKVRQRTEPHFRPAQIPTLWGEKSTLDVLLAAYPQPPVSDKAIRQFRATAERLDRKDYSAAMIAYANELSENDRQDAAVEILKTVQGLGELTAEARYTLASALSVLGRTGEAERTYAPFAQMPAGFWHDLGVTSSNSRALDPAQRLASALHLFDTTNDWLFKLLAYNVVVHYGNHEQKVMLAQRLAAEATTPRAKRYGASQLAYYEGRWADSIREADEARKSPGAQPTDLVLYLAKVEPLIAVGDRKALDAFYDEGLVFPGLAAFAWMGKAQLAKERNDPKARIVALQTALKNDPSPEQIFLIAKTAGAYIALVKDDLKRAASRYPYSWRARFMVALVDNITHDPAAKDELLATDRYGDDPLTVNAALFDFLETFMTEAVELGTVKVDVFRTQTDLFFLMLKDEIAHFGYDSDLWLQIVRYGMFNERTAQVNALVAANLRFPAERAPKDLKPALVLLAMNRGDDAAVQRLYERGFEATEKADPAWMIACYDASRGRTKEAAARIATLRPPSADFQTRMEALKTYLLAANAKPEEARKRLGAPTDDAVVNAFHGLAWAELGDWKRAEPLLLESATKRVWAFLFLQKAALQRLDARYRSTGRATLCRDLALSAAISQPGNPLFDSLSFAPKPGIAWFVGSSAMDGGTLDDKDPNVRGKVSFTVDPMGAFTGRLQPPDGEPLKMIGKVDAYGNVRGTGTWHGKRYAMTAKIAPASLYVTYRPFKTSGQLFQLVGPDATRIVVIGRPK